MPPGRAAAICLTVAIATTSVRVRRRQPSVLLARAPPGFHRADSDCAVLRGARFEHPRQQHVPRHLHPLVKLRRHSRRGSVRHGARACPAAATAAERHHAVVAGRPFLVCAPTPRPSPSAPRTSRALLALFSTRTAPFPALNHPPRTPPRALRRPQPSQFAAPALTRTLHLRLTRPAPRVCP